MPIDRCLTSGATLTPRRVGAAAFEPIVRYVDSTQRPDGSCAVVDDVRRDRLLAEYRAAFNEQLVHDMSFNVQALWSWADNLQRSRPAGCDVVEDALVRDGFRRLGALRRFVVQNDGWSGNQAELSCGLAFQQFYCDALALGHRLLLMERGRRPRRRPPARLRRTEIPGAASYGWAQALLNAAEIGIPGILTLRPMRSVLPAALYLAARFALPWPAFRFAEWLDKLHHMVRSGALASLNDSGRGLTEYRGVSEFFSDPYYFDHASGRTRHNVIFVFAHRHPVIDVTILADLFKNQDYGVWGNARYFPASVRRDPRVVLVEQAGQQALEPALKRSRDLLAHQGLPVIISVDGTIPYLCYGQQMRVKRGIRRLVDFMQAQSSGSPRRTYILPATFDDSVTFVQGLDPTIRVTLHPPICTADIAPAPLDRGRINWGDPLLNHLECLFIAHSGQVRHGWRTPPVIETVRRMGGDIIQGPAVRRRLRRRLHPTLSDLSRVAATEGL